METQGRFVRIADFCRMPGGRYCFRENEGIQYFIGEKVKGDVFLNKRKIRKGICIGAAALIGVSLVSFALDSLLAEIGRTPVLSIRYQVATDEESAHYLGLGYQITLWRRYSEGADEMGPVLFTGVEKKYLFGINLAQENPSVPLTRERSAE